MILYRLVALLSRPLIRAAFRPAVRGSEHLPADGGFVLAANHLSGWDALALSYALFPRPTRNMAKNQLFKRPLLGPIMRSLGGFPAQAEGVVGGVVAAADLAAGGEAVVIYPEGARRRPDREHPPRSGAARAALEAGVPLVPAAIGGTDGWRRLRRWEIAVGPPVSLDELRGGDPLKSSREATRRLWGSITALEAAFHPAR